MKENHKSLVTTYRKLHKIKKIEIKIGGRSKEGKGGREQGGLGEESAL